ncbi:hypothetical protein [Burkholderia cepacia]|uniref:hypothetical protein n=1 Tax=Burkholderia cepacia TaxID=292 RepID=UPI001CF5E016|nr:hypothetical protein [Burkholderia cepacia]MCA8326099.1 hypothetical protein [Burkholderia cepacia]
MAILYHLLRWAFGMGLALVFGELSKSIDVRHPESIVAVGMLLWTIWCVWDLLRWVRSKL